MTKLLFVIIFLFSGEVFCYTGKEMILDIYDFTYDTDCAICKEAAEKLPDRIAADIVSEDVIPNRLKTSLLAPSMYRGAGRRFILYGDISAREDTVVAALKVTNPLNGEVKSYKNSIPSDSYSPARVSGISLAMCSKIETGFFAFVKVTSDPESAYVKIDNSYAGITPVEFIHFVGPCSLSVSHENFRTYSKNIEIMSGSNHFHSILRPVIKEKSQKPFYPTAVLAGASLASLVYTVYSQSNNRYETARVYRNITFSFTLMTGLCHFLNREGVF
ncbi:MAG: PEGA domain-containing protein [Fibrobacterota bacterium]